MLAPFRSRGYVTYSIAAASLVLATALRYRLHSILGDHLCYSFFYLAVAVSAWSGGIKPAIVATAFSCVIAENFFSRGDSSITGWARLIDLLLFVTVSLVIGSLSEISLRALERARIAERAKDDFMATLAHELRSPLSVIQYANAVNRLSPSEQSNDTSEMIERQVHRLDLMVQDLLDVSRVARGKIRLERRQIDARAVVQGAVERARPAIDSRRHKLTVQVSPEPMPLFGDPDRLEQVVTNLLTNAAKYTPEEGELTISAAPVGDNVVFTVRDSGIGISAEMLPLVFDMFVQAEATSSASESGLGIGLALVKKLVEMHGGSVHAASPGLNRGCEFTVSLPLHIPAPLQRPLVNA